MASKYDAFWLSKRDLLGELLREVAERGTSRRVDLSEIRSLGDRTSWYGRVEVQGGRTVVDGQSAHVRALGHVLSELSARYRGTRFRAMTSGRCELHLEGVPLAQLDPAPPDPDASGAAPDHTAPVPAGEEIPGGPRITRVGINDSDGKFVPRLKAHFSGRRTNSVFRKHLGGALLRRQGAPPEEVRAWLSEELAASDPTVAKTEAEVSHLLRERFAYACRAETLVIFPCSARKRVEPPLEPTLPPRPDRRLEQFLVQTAPLLRQGRAALHHYIEAASPHLPALECYDGGLYGAPGFRPAVAAALADGRAEALVFSGAYGAVLADEPIQRYDKKLDAPFWRRNGLPLVIEEFVRISGVRRVVAFAARSSPYWAILQSVDWDRLYADAGLQEALCFTVQFQGAGGAQRAVPAALGAAIAGFLQRFDAGDVLAQSWNGQRVVMEELGAGRGSG